MPNRRCGIREQNELVQLPGLPDRLPDQLLSDIPEQ
jgi:hypothetical protein